MYMVMLCLGELAIAIPVAGSFQTYAREFIHPVAGFCVGWLYWLNGVLTIAADFVVAATLLVSLWSGIPIWAWITFWFIILLSLNILSVGIFGESGFWFASIKVIAILAMILIGTTYIFGFSIGESQGFIGLSRYFGEGGPFPKGLTLVFGVMVIVAYSLKLSITQQSEHSYVMFYQLPLLLQSYHGRQLGLKKVFLPSYLKWQEFLILLKLCLLLSLHRYSLVVIHGSTVQRGCSGP